MLGNLDERGIFVEKQAVLLESLYFAKSLVDSLREKQKWTLSYPRREDFTILKVLKPNLNESFILNLEESALSNLLYSKLLDVNDHLERLAQRISDTTSKILITGDLNAGKSTLINALLQTDLLPSDQQPCTMAFCEIMDACKNGEKLEVHCIPNLKAYNGSVNQNYKVVSLDALKHVVCEETVEEEWFKIFCHDKRDDSLLRNGVIDVTLIDAPGLNTDSVKTMSLFAKQDDIDVVVFVVNAANHLTLSAREFLQAAAKEKSFIFIVINKFDDISNKEKCKRIILSQVQEVLPRTFEESNDLIHFVSAKNQLDACLNSQSHLPEFARLENSLRSFIIDKRTRSKLWPARTFLLHLVSDFAILIRQNKLIATTKLQQSIVELDQCAPVYEKLNRIKDKFSADLEKCANETCGLVSSQCERILNSFVDDIESYIDEIEWKGILFTFFYINSVIQHVGDRQTVELETLQHITNEFLVSGIHQMYSLASCQVWEIFNKTPDVKSMTSQLEIAQSGAKISIKTWDLLRVKLNFGATLLGSASVTAGVIWGYKRIIGFAADVLRFIPLISMRSTIFMCVGGFGFFFMTQMRSIVRANLSSRLRSHYVTAHFASVNAGNCEQAARRILKIPLWDLQKHFHQALHHQEQLRFEREKNRVLAQESFSYFEGLEGSAQQIRNKVDSISE